MISMPSRLANTARFALLATALLLAGCSRAPNKANPENGGDTDPALTSALEDQILVDPSLAQQSNRNALRPPEAPLQAPYPAATPASAGTGAGDLLPGSCAAEVEYGLGWLKRLPDTFAVYPGARVTDAAGNERGTCNLRVVTFRSPAQAERLLDFYAERVAAAGYSTERQVRGADRILGGTNETIGAAYYVVVTPVRGGSDVALIAHLGA
jgi:hypothetical protein